jgi:tetratricopeptide (TPR) repeat protein
MLVFTTASFIGMAITSGLAVTAYLARIEAEEQRRIAEIEAETAKQTTDFMVGLFAVSDPSESLGNTITAREILDKGAERVETELADQPEIQATLMDTMGTVYKSLGLYDAAAPLVAKSVERRRSIFGDDHLAVAQSLNHLGEVQALKAEYNEAEKNLREALAVRRDFLGSETPEVAETLTQLAYVLTEKGEYAAAEPLIRESLGIRRPLPCAGKRRANFTPISRMRSTTLLSCSPKPGSSRKPSHCTRRHWQCSASCMVVSIPI